MTAHEKRWAIILFILVILAYFIPYNVLSDVTAWYGSFLCWVLITLAVIVINFYISKDWGKK